MTTPGVPAFLGRAIPPDRPLWIRCSSLIQGRGGPPLRDAAILVENGRITGIGSGSDLARPQDAVCLELDGYTVLPGLVDAHSHLYWFSRSAPEPLSRQLEDPPEILGARGLENLALDLTSGVLAMRVVSERNLTAIRWREEIRAGRLRGPRLVAGGIGIRAPRGHGKMAAPCDGPEAVRRAVRENLAAAADVIKIYVSGEITDETDPRFCYLSEQEIRVAVEEASRAGRPVAAHCHGGEGLRACVLAGVRTVEHGAFLTESDLDLLIEHQTWLVATLSMLFHPEGMAPELAARPDVRQKRQQAGENLRQYLVPFARSGGRLAVGTDARHGLMAFELQCLCSLGFSPMEAIQIATAGSAEACGLSSELGTLEVGKTANIFAVSRDPLQDIRALEVPALLMKEGKVLGGPIGR